MVGPTDRQCGVGIYTALLRDALAPFARVPEVIEPAAYRAAQPAGDLVHVQHEYHLFGGVAPWKCRARRLYCAVKEPMVLTAHEFVEAKGRSAAWRAAIGLTNRMHFGYSGARAILVHTRSDRDRMIASGLPEDRLHVVRHGIQPAPPLPRREEARARLSLEGRFVVAVFGYLSARKGHLVAIDAVSRLPADTLLLIAGGRHPADATGHAEAVERAAAAAGARVRVTGVLTDDAYLDALAACDVAAAPFLECSASSSLSLAVSCGRAVVASDIPVNREFDEVCPGALALFAAGDAGQLAETLMAVRADRTKLEALEAGSRRYAERHGFDRMAAQTAAVYRSVLGEA
jgi:glycosyltransferase involved in cell wall biosynthesis